ncbi:hypothetical protein D3P07_09635 [Paenibacillus sp. 1011MAR3C5]|uniref:DUF5412 family protein n=1 Tax=Paenibacillus sp. 1011MAR3C5 TaxID=1675787 RepID=UPI000E6D3EE7|nr:DUF5412 family protein [Paenibacillus sp. 1011MAR3C5]RJE90441.1 hypothetical protein D3P07_09635 [Paenibacillus sp. 1011MAR3C5]
MKKYIIIIVVGILAVFSYLTYTNLTYEFNYDSGVKDEELISPSGNYTAQVYYHYYGGAAGGVNVYVNVIFHLEDDIERTVYYSDAKTFFHIKWLDDDKLSIANIGGGDRSIVLTVGKDIYDETGKACRKYVINKKYSCYSKNSV